MTCMNALQTYVTHAQRAIEGNGEKRVKWVGTWHEIWDLTSGFIHSFDCEDVRLRLADKDFFYTMVLWTAGEISEDNPGRTQDLHSTTAGTVTWDRGRALPLAATPANSR